MAERGISNKKLASMCGISAAAIGKILGGADFKVSNLEAIAKALGVSVGVFFDEERGSNIAIGRSHAGDGNIILGSNFGGSGDFASTGLPGGVVMADPGSEEQIIATQKDEIIELQNRVIALQAKLLNAQDK